jgi:hypothetical protein
MSKACFFLQCFCAAALMSVTWGAVMWVLLAPRVGVTVACLIQLFGTAAMFNMGGRRHG